MPDVTLTIDGVKVTVPAGTTVVEAARQVGIAIPVFCHHPKLVPVGMCRMCVVEVGTPKLGPDRKPELDEQGNPVIAKMPKPQPSCTTPVSEGMVVWTTTEDIQFAQRGVLEMLLQSHPLDCPVCDKGGECPLQNLTMQWGPSISRMDYRDKIHFEKPVPLGDLIYLDRERCILCARCVRFQDEVAGDPVLGFDQRGRNWQIISKSDPPFDSKFSGNTTDICPVGALTSADFRFKARVWELKPVATVCPHCPVGCNMTLDMRYDDVLRVMPRENEAVNELWICDRGRYGHHFVSSKERLTTPLIRKGGSLQPTTWEEAIAYVGEQLDSIRDSSGGSSIGGIAGPHLPNEDLYLFQKFFRDVLGSNNLDHRPGSRLDLPLDDQGALLGLPSGTNLGDLGKGTLALVVGADPEEEAPVYLLRLMGIANRGGTLATVNIRGTKLDRFATHVVRPRIGSEASVLATVVKALLEKGAENDRMRGVDELKASLRGLNLTQAAGEAGVDEAQLTGLIEAIAGAENLVVVYGRDARAAGEPLLRALANILLLTGKAGQAGSGLLALLEANNSRGALDMGVRPDKGPGYVTQQKPGLSARAMLEAARNGKLRALYIVGSDPVATDPSAAAALKEVGLVVVQELFLTETAKLADVVLPAAAFAEREGSYTNAERRVQRFRQARRAEGQSRPDWEIFQAVARQLVEAAVTVEAVGGGKRRKDKEQRQATLNSEDWRYSSPAEVMAEIAREVPGYQGISYQKLNVNSQQAAMPSFQSSAAHHQPYNRMGGGDLRWDRQVNDPLYYDGTAYKNIGGLGLQWPAPIEHGLNGHSLRPLTSEQAAAPGAERPFVLVPITRLYDSTTLLDASELLNNRKAPPEVLINKVDADRLRLTTGTQVRLRSSLGELVLRARVSKEPAPGTVLVPLDVDGIALSDIATGQRTAVSLESVKE